MHTVTITSGYHNGRTGVLVREGTFDVFGIRINGAIVDIDGHDYAFERGEYAVTGEYAKPTVPSRFVRMEVLC